MRVTLPELPFDVPPKPRELTAAAPSRGGDVTADVVTSDGDEETVDIIESEGVRWGPRRDWGKV